MSGFDRGHRGFEETLSERLAPDLEEPETAGNAMLYGNGGAGKTTLSVDLGFHLAAGDDWLGIPVLAPCRVLLIEAEGPRPLFRAKLRRKREAWRGSPLDGRLHVWGEPWASFSFAEADDRAQLALMINELELDLVIAGPLTAIGCRTRAR
jgi:hypothetical protein